MTQKTPTSEQAERDARRAEALRANLKRRKAAVRKDAGPAASSEVPEKS